MPEFNMPIMRILRDIGLAYQYADGPEFVDTRAILNCLYSLIALDSWRYSWL